MHIGLIPSKDLNTFQDILKLVKLHLTVEQWQAIEAEIMTLYNRHFLSTMAADRLRILLHRLRDQAYANTKKEDIRR